MFPGILPDRIRAMLSSWKRPALVALTTFYLSHIAHSGESIAVRGEAILEQTHTIVQATVDQSLKQSGQLIVLTGPKRVEGTYTYASAGSLRRVELGVPRHTRTRLRP